MPAHKKYDSEEARKAADAKRKRDKRVSDKNAKKLKLAMETNKEWISRIVLKLANDVPKKSVQLQAKRQKNRERKVRSRYVYF